ncbi:MAG: response regulator transcription factor [Marinifilaceae bacterium]
MDKGIKKVAIIEPSWIVREGLRDLIALYKEFKVISVSDDLHSFNDKYRVEEPDIVVMNPNVVDYSKRGAVRSCFGNTTAFALIAIQYSFVESDVLRQFDDYIEVTDQRNRIIKKLETALPPIKEEKQEGSELSDREIEILIAVAKGKTNKEIADEHNISIHTVISHRKNITRKIGIKSVSGLTVYALLNNLIDQNDIEL